MGMQPAGDREFDFHQHVRIRYVAIHEAADHFGLHASRQARQDLTRAIRWQMSQH